MSGYEVQHLLAYSKILPHAPLPLFRSQLLFCFIILGNTSYAVDTNLLSTQSQQLLLYINLDIRSSGMFCSVYS